MYVKMTYRKHTVSYLRNKKLLQYKKYDYLLLAKLYINMLRLYPIILY